MTVTYRDKGTGFEHSSSTWHTNWDTHWFLALTFSKDSTCFVSLFHFFADACTVIQHCEPLVCTARSLSLTLLPLFHLYVVFLSSHRIDDFISQRNTVSESDKIPPANKMGDIILLRMSYGKTLLNCFNIYFDYLNWTYMGSAKYYCWAELWVICIVSTFSWPRSEYDNDI